eukprot:TRINITY_DN2_c0_g2_i1.p1 TRINITY_DN2_c0_g2~~TRINITY_DN2_c0_g2_i1.p1  ORF type:complete len:467 (-),score=123.89 TRINITY_DN2_c0_g2_i1:51-1451(-)
MFSSLQMRRAFSTAANANLRVGIVGGGPGGISAAWYLQKKKGYSNITVLEKDASVGGKALTINVTDRMGITKNSELGAEYIPYHYDHIYDIIKEVGEPTGDAPVVRTIGKNGQFLNPIASEKLTDVIPAAIRYFWIGWKNRGLIDQPSNKNIGKHPILGGSMANLLDKYKLQPLKGVFVMKQFGYGNWNDFPAVQLYRSVHIRTFIRVLGEEIPILKRFFKRPIAAMAVNGTQGIFKKLAFLIDQRQRKSTGKQLLFCNSELTKIELRDGKVIVSVNDKEDYAFDKLIVTIPPDNLLRLMPALGAQEKQLFSKILYRPYWVGNFEVKDVQLPHHYFQNLSPEGDLELVQITKRWNDSDVCARGYIDEPCDLISSGDAAKVERVEKEFRRFMKERMGVSDVATEGYACKFWENYYPHVSLTDFQAGFYDQVEALQGKNGIYFAGSAMQMESMDQTVKYSDGLVTQHF